VYVPYERQVFGLGMASDDLLKRTLGYDGSLVDRRLATLRSVYDAGDDEQPAAPVERIRAELGRPLVIVLDPARDVRLAAWLTGHRDATMLYDGVGRAAWLLGPGSQPAAGLP
jgi:hypothetical protein